MDRDFFDLMYNQLTEIYSDLEGIMGNIYYELQNNSENSKNIEYLQEIGNVAIKVLSSKIQLVEDYGDPDFKDNLLNNLYDKISSLSVSLKNDRDKFR